MLECKGPISHPWLFNAVPHDFESPFPAFSLHDQVLKIALKDCMWQGENGSEIKQKYNSVISENLTSVSTRDLRKNETIRVKEPCPVPGTLSDKKELLLVR